MAQAFPLLMRETSTVPGMNSNMKSSTTLSTVSTILRAVQCIAFLILLLLLAVPAHAQQAPATLSLDEAISLARRYNPQFRTVANDAAGADWQVRSAYGHLLPSVSVGGGLSYQLAGTERIGNFEDVARPAAYGSSYNAGASLQLSGASLFRISEAKAQRSMTDARITAAEYQLAADITQQYLAAKRTSDEVVLREQQLETADAALKVAQARFDAGDKPRLDAAQAEVARGRAEVDLLQARNAARAARRALLQLIGVEVDRDVELTTALTVFEPKWTLDELVATAMSTHPQLLAARAAERAGKASARAASMAYLPSLSLSAGVYGYTRATADENQLIANAEENITNARENCEEQNELNEHLATPLPGYPRDCSKYVFTQADREAAVAANEMFPFNFTKTPVSLGLSISLPIFNGFSRTVQTQQARAQAQDASYAARAEELNRKALVADAFDALNTAYTTVSLEDRNAEVAAEQLRLAQGRYAAGAGSMYELMEAQSLKAQADQARLVAVYTFHQDIALLENAVGTKLR
jgi:outer membrane protein TolC